MPDAVLLPVTVSATRRARPGCEARLRDWAATLCAAAAATPGYLDSRVAPRGRTAVTVSLTFVSAAALAGWVACAPRAACLAVADELTEGTPVARVPAPPPRWRTALVVWAGLFPFSLLFTATAGPVVSSWPVLAQALASSVMLVPLAVYVGIPLVERLLAALRQRRA